MISVKKFVPAFMVLIIFVSSLMAACITGFRKAPVTGETPDAPASNDLADRNDNHVFHTGLLRGVWIPYFCISDNEPLGEYEFIRRYDELLDTAVSCGINAVFVHVRAHCDAAYYSDIFPPMDIYRIHQTTREYDPLGYMVKAAHERGLEFHAWINPYRIAANASDVPTDNIVGGLIDESDVIRYDGGLYIDPSSENGRALIVAGAAEIAENYDVDGIHMDDYFYPNSEDEADDPAYDRYKNSGGEKTLRQWRCDNVSLLIKEMYETIKSIDSRILFGVSPQGNYENDLSIGADALAWCEGGYVDYIAPQIYYNSLNPVCPFEKTADFWRDIADKTGVKMYAGLALYKVGTDADGGTWDDDDIMQKQEEYIARRGDGVIFYSMCNVL